MVTVLEMTPKQLTTVQVCISAFVSVTPLDIFKETSGQFQDLFVLCQKSLQLTNLMFVIKPWDISG